MAKVLVVEDDALLSKLYHSMLTNAGYTVVNAENGEEGVAMATKEKPDVMILDVMMPKMNGLQVLDALKKDPVTKGIPVIVLTGLKKVNEEKDVIARGAMYYLDKGEFDPKRVADLIKQVLEWKAAQRPKQS